jgi:hypothetical protein
MVCWKAFKILLGKKFYLPSAIVTAAILFLILAYLEQFLFTQPFAFFVPNDEILIFSLVSLISILSGLTVPLAVYKILNYKFTISNAKEFLAVVFGVAAGCGCSVALSLIAVTGTIGSSIIGFINLYQNPIRLLSIALLAYSFYAELQFLSKLHCR